MTPSRILLVGAVLALLSVTSVAAAEGPTPDWEAQLGLGTHTQVIARTADGRRELVLVTTRALSCGVYTTQEVRIVRTGASFDTGSIVQLSTGEQRLTRDEDGSALAQSVARRLRRQFPRSA